MILRGEGLLHRIFEETRNIRGGCMYSLDKIKLVMALNDLTDTISALGLEGYMNVQNHTKFCSVRSVYDAPFGTGSCGPSKTFPSPCSHHAYLPQWYILAGLLVRDISAEYIGSNLLHQSTISLLS